MEIAEELQKQIKGEIKIDDETRKKYSRDTSIFELTPQVVIEPANAEDIEHIVSFVVKNKKENPSLSITARAAGTDMTGGPLTDSLLLDFTKHFTHIKKISDGTAVVEPGVYFREFEKALNEHGLMYPPYPASKDLCALGGIVNNNSGGEKTLKYGKTNKFILGLDVVLSDGKSYHMTKLNSKELKEKLALKTFEGEIYKKIYKVLKDNYETIQKSRINVTKNSSGYNIWDAYDGENLDLTQLICGAQGTLGIVTEAKLKVVPREKHEKLYVVFMNNLHDLPHFTQDVLKLKPTSLEITDKHTFKIYLRYAREMASLLGAHGILGTIKLFMPETLLILKHGIPEFIVLVEFEGDDEKIIMENIHTLEKIVQKYKMSGRFCKTKLEANKYWKLRRDTFKLLREKIKDKHSTPFVDDISIRAEDLPTFIPELTGILDKHKIFYTISGHLGDGNLHIIPLMDLRKKEERDKVHVVTDEVYNLIIKYKGSLSAEHNDGLIRSPYLVMEYGEKIYEIFKEIKQIFDPDNIFNPHKKIGVTKEFAYNHMIDN